jgi:hypothetical protein
MGERACPGAALAADYKVWRFANTSDSTEGELTQSYMSRIGQKIGP